FDRGSDLLNIDFTGGSSVTMVLRDEERMSFSEVMDALEETDLSDQNLSIVEVGNTGTRFTVSTTEQDVIAVQKILQDRFGDKLETYRLEVKDVAPVGSAAQFHSPRRKVSARLVN